ncbi:MAG: patatin-like phospholipase family protein, partial [Terriglobales bacterium]
MNRISPFEGTHQRSYNVPVRIALVLFTLSVSSLITVAQDGAPAPKRLTIGVALEGGGALGLAHIGVLRWFEQHHIPIDYLSGNSMGALVGGMYATGKSPDELERLVKQMDWPLVISGQTPYQDLSYRRKEDARAVQNDLVIGFKHGATL